MTTTTCQFCTWEFMSNSDGCIHPDPYAEYEEGPIVALYKHYRQSHPDKLTEALQP